MTSNDAAMDPDVAIREELRDLGVIQCEISEISHMPPPAAPDSRLIESMTGGELLVSVPDGLRAPCFRLSLPGQDAVARIVITDVEELAERIGAGHPAKGIGLSANQSASLIPAFRKLALEKTRGQAHLSEAQRKASLDEGAVPAYFRYRDPHGNVIRVFNPIDVTPRVPDGSYAVETDIRGEGCLSSMMFRGQVPRPIKMIVDGEDLAGQVFRVTALGPAARLLGHEVSHVTRGIDGLCIIEGGLPVLTLAEWSQVEPEVRDWRYDIDFTATPYLEISDPDGSMDSSQVMARLLDQGLFTPTEGK